MSMVNPKDLNPLKKKVMKHFSLTDEEFESIIISNDLTELVELVFLEENLN